MMKSLNYRLVRSLAVIMTGVTLSACAGLTPSDNGLIARDMLEIKNKLNEVSANQASSDRMLEAALSGIDVSLKDREDIVKNVIDDMEKRMREQNDEIQRVRAQLQEMTFALDSLSKRLGMSDNAAATATSPVADTTGAAIDPAAPAPTDTQAPVGAAVDQAISSAMRQYSIGNYTEAREGFRQALEQQPDDEKKVEILFWLGETCNQLKDYPVALDNYWAVINLKPDNIRAWKSLERMAGIKDIQGDFPRALEMLQQIESLYPNYPDIADVKAKISEIQAKVAPPEPTPEPAPAQPAPPPSVPSTPVP
jgi:TolA-binding protein